MLYISLFLAILFLCLAVITRIRVRKNLAEKIMLPRAAFHRLPKQYQIYDMILKLFNRLSALVSQKTSSYTLTQYQEKIKLAGHPYGFNAERFLTFKIMVIMIFAVAGGLFFLTTGNYFLPLAAFAFSVWAPEFLLNKLKAQRQELIRSSLLDAIELLEIPSRAGVNFSRAVKDAAKESDNVVIKELEKCYTEITAAGKDTSDSMKDLVTRTQVAELESFVRALQYNQELGVPISSFLSSESKRMRDAKKVKIQEAGQKIASKVMIAAIVIMGPAFLLIMFGPVASYLDVIAIFEIGEMAETPQ